MPTTSAPSRAKATAVARPIPRAAPVTTATFRCRHPSRSLLSYESPVFTSDTWPRRHSTARRAGTARTSGSMSAPRPQRSCPNASDSSDITARFYCVPGALRATAGHRPSWNPSSDFSWLRAVPVRAMSGLRIKARRYVGAREGWRDWRRLRRGVEVSTWVPTHRPAFLGRRVALSAERGGSELGAGRPGDTHSGAPPRAGR
jgi:hypothetical protein